MRKRGLIRTILFVIIVGIVGALGWVTYIVCDYFKLPNILSYFISL